MKQSGIRFARSVLLVSAVASVLWVSAGSLTPPSGPVAPTMKDLNDVSPRTAIRNDFVNITPIVIDAPGSYYLAENIIALPGQHGITIDADHVTLDLNGFTVFGNTEVGSLDGIHIVDGRNNITIKNGTVRDFFQNGIYGGMSSGCYVENVRVVNNSSYGMRLGGVSRIINCIAIGNGQSGIHGGGGTSVVSGCVAQGNGSWGIWVGSGGLVRDSVAVGNDDGIQVGLGGLIASCTAVDNASSGLIAAIVGGIMHGCTAFNNLSDFQGNNRFDTPEDWP